jgi:phosphatidylglycerophosphatase A
MLSGIYSGRRTIVWKNLRTPKSVVAMLVATALGAGLFPLAPGTMGSLVAIPLAFWSNSWHMAVRLAFWLILTGLGTWAAKIFDEKMQTGDNQNIVIDEVIGLGITAWTAGQEWKTLTAAFIFFRFFDIVKIPPVLHVDLWSKNQASSMWAGFGVIADDIVAGFQALGVILLLQWLQYLP